MTQKKGKGPGKHQNPMVQRYLSQAINKQQESAMAEKAIAKDEALKARLAAEIGHIEFDPDYSYETIWKLEDDPLDAILIAEIGHIDFDPDYSYETVYEPQGLFGALPYESDDPVVKEESHESHYFSVLRELYFDKEELTQKELEVKDYNEFEYRDFGHAYPACIYGVDENEVRTPAFNHDAGNILGRFGISFEAHMAHFKIYVQKCKTKADEKELAEDEEWENNVRSEEDGLPSNSLDAQASKVIIYINWQAHQNIGAVPLHSSDMANHSPDERARISSLSPSMLKQAQEIEENGGRPILLELMYDPEQIASERLYLDTPNFADAFVDATKSGRLALILSGHEGTTHQLKIMAQFLDWQKGFGNNPLDQWHSNGRRRVIALNRLPTESTRGLEKRAFKYESRWAYFDWDEYVTVAGSSMAQEHKALLSQRSNYENETHTLKLLELAGSQDGGTYLAFLPYPDEDGFRVSAGMKLKITFVDEGPSTDLAELYKGNIANPEDFYRLRTIDQFREGYDSHGVLSLKAFSEHISSTTSLIMAEEGELSELSWDAIYDIAVDYFCTARTDTECKTFKHFLSTMNLPIEFETMSIWDLLGRIDNLKGMSSLPETWEGPLLPPWEQEPYLPPSAPAPSLKAKSSLPRNIYRDLYTVRDPKTWEDDVEGDFLNESAFLDRLRDLTSKLQTDTRDDQSLSSEHCKLISDLVVDYYRTKQNNDLRKEVETFLRRANITIVPDEDMEGLFEELGYRIEVSVASEASQAKEVAKLNQRTAAIPNARKDIGEFRAKLAEDGFVPYNPRVYQALADYRKRVESSEDADNPQTVNDEELARMLQLLEDEQAAQELSAAWSVQQDEPKPEVEAEGERAADPELEEDENSGSEWEAVVAEPISFCPPDHFAAYIKRPWSRDAMQYESQNVRIIPKRDLLFDEIMTAIHSDPGNQVEIRVDDRNNSVRQNISALDSLNYAPADRPHQTFNTMMKEILVCKDLTKLPKKDIFAAVRSEFEDQGIRIEDMMTLNAQQLKGVRAAKEAIGGIQITLGPPGTGKTYLTGQYFIPFARSQQGGNMLFVAAPSNKAAREQVRCLNANLKALQDAGKAPANGYVVRAYAKATEEQIRIKQTQVYVPQPGDRPKVDKDIALEELDEVDVLIMDHYRKHNEYPEPDIMDKRVEDRKLSIGYRMLIIAGVILKKGEKAPVKWAGWRSLYDMKAKGEPMNKEQNEQYVAATKMLFDFVIKHALAVVGTTYQMGASTLVKACEPYVTLLVLDEACRERPDNCFPLWAARFSKINGVLLVGDPFQLAPVTMVERRHNVFRRFLQIAVMAQLIYQGFPYVFLTQQSRIIPAIAALADHLTYRGKLINSKLTKISNRPYAQAFRDNLAKTNIGAATNVLFLDVPESDISSVCIGSSKSKYNDFYVISAIQFAEKLLQIQVHERRPTIGILTPYTAQRNSYLIAKRNMMIQKVPGAAGISIDTFDGAQSEEYDYVIMDLPMGTDTVGFLADPRRLNVALTRARDALIIIGSKNAIFNAKGNSVPARRLFKACKKQGSVETVKIQEELRGKKTYKIWPRSKYFEPEQKRFRGDFKPASWVSAGHQSIFTEGLNRAAKQKAAIAKRAAKKALEKEAEKAETEQPENGEAETEQPENGEAETEQPEGQSLQFTAQGAAAFPTSVGDEENGGSGSETHEESEKGNGWDQDDFDEGAPPASGW